MARWLLNCKFQLSILAVCAAICAFGAADVAAKRSNDDLTACQHLRRAESRRARAMAGVDSRRIRIPRCTKLGDFERIQCADEALSKDCWCTDEYGVEIPGTRNETRESVECSEPKTCSASHCRMFCASGFARDSQTGCSICRCRDPCDGIECPSGQICQQQEVKCVREPCPPVPTCKKARSIANYCPAGMPLAIESSVRPFLCGLESGKPTCPPLYRCIVEPGNDYGVCCPSAFKFKKPGVCPSPEKADFTKSTGYMCGLPCSHDLECKNMEKCCFTKGCQFNCQQPFNVTNCHQARALSDLMSIDEREGRGYIPECNESDGQFSPKQCSRNGLVCWCVDPRTGHKIKGTMGAAAQVVCEGWENMVGRSLGRSFSVEHCDTNICAAVCEYGFKNDHNGCPTCECSEPCEGFICGIGSHCEIATDPLCKSGSTYCSSSPVCKPDLAYSNPCEFGTPSADNVTGEIHYCFEEDRQSRAFEPTAFFEPEEDIKESRAMSNRAICPANHKCTRLHGEKQSVCCPLPEDDNLPNPPEEEPSHQLTMCEYLRDFSERMEGTEEGMQLAIPAPRCSADGMYSPRQCQMKKIKVTLAEQRKILEENTIRKMKMLLSPARSRRDVSVLKLYRVDDSNLRVRSAGPVMGRNAKVIDMGAANKHQAIGQLFGTDVKKIAPITKRPDTSGDLVEIEVEQCWCVDSFGTEIPRSRGFNVTDESCAALRESIDCLDLTCRMGCEYGFILDAESRCPACQCRDPCDGVDCGDAKECRVVDVSCDEEYCPPVPACLPRKPGQCPFLVPPGSENVDTNYCAYDCRTDSHCEGTKRCCSNGCGTQCVEPQLKTACQHLQAIQLHQSSELGVPAKQMYVAQCEAASGKWKEVQCGPDGSCWCVDAKGQAISGTRTKTHKSPICKQNSAFECPFVKCAAAAPCANGYKIDANGCRTCECRNLCDEIPCSSDEECQLISVVCVDAPCPDMPICVPRRESVCPEGSPLRQGDVEVSCGPHNEAEICPTTHTCQLNPVTHRGVCCTKTRDVCFESIADNTSCLAKSDSANNVTRFRFNPKLNKCVPVVINTDVGICPIKNLFHSELACNSVCPVLTQCERLKLKNSLAAQRSGETSAWFQPRCDPITGHWSPVQCLGRQPSQDSDSNNVDRLSGPGSADMTMSSSPYGVCWCADRKGAPLKGTLTRDLEPVCNSRQARRRVLDEATDPLMEDLIRQMTLLVDVDNEVADGDSENRGDSPKEERTNTERIAITVAKSPTRLAATTSRCRALKRTASFPITCETDGAFHPTQCNFKQCWCVDAAGNQIPSTNTFRRGAAAKRCEYTPIESVAIELHMQNLTATPVRNLYDIIRMELHQMLGNVFENLRVQENLDGSAMIRLELHNAEKVDLAYAIEEAIESGNFILGNGQYQTDLTRSHFIHNSASQPPVAQASTSAENTIQVVVFILASSSAFLVSIFVVFIMLKRGKQKCIPNCNNSHTAPCAAHNKIIGCGDKAVDYTSPIFVLSMSSNDYDSIKPKVVDSSS